MTHSAISHDSPSGVAISNAVSPAIIDNRPATTDSEPVRPTLGAIQDTWGALV